MNKRLLYITLAACTLLLAGCGNTKTTEKTAETISPAAFSADSAYAYTDAQVALGARVPGSEAHRACEAYLCSTLQRWGWQVEVQEGHLPNYTEKQQRIRNIIGKYRPEMKNRVLLCAHWDCRPWCDQEANPDLWMTPVTGANDAASGVGVLLEVARQLHLLQPEKGVDIVFFDAEDMGTPEFYQGQHKDTYWCLGSQLWSQAVKSHSGDYQYGILLDMCGAPNATFPREHFSERYASSYVDKVWQTAMQLGYGHLFVGGQSYPLTDDHYFVNTIAGIPCIDIIHYDRSSGTGFPAYWHTTHDDMSNVSAATLGAVGTTVLTVLLNE